MPLSESVANTQTGSNVDSIEATNVNLSNLGTTEQQVEQPVEQPPVEQQVEQPVEQPPVTPPPNDWQKIYDYVQGSEDLYTELGYDDFVKKYSGNESNMNNLFSHVAGDALDSGKESPFKSTNYKTFKNEERSFLQTNTGLGDINPVIETGKDEIDKSNEAQEEVNKKMTIDGSISNASTKATNVNSDNLLDNESVTNLVAGAAAGFGDGNTNPNIPDREASTFQDQSNLFVDLWDTEGDKGIDTWDIIGKQRVNTTTGSVIDEEVEDIQVKEKRYSEIKLDHDTAKNLIDKFFTGYEKRVANGSIKWEDIDHHDLTKLITSNEKIAATLYYNPQLESYFYNTATNMVNHGKEIASIRKNTGIRDEILNDFNQRRTSNQKFSENLQERFGGSSIEEVMLLDNKHISTLINTYAASGDYTADEAKTAVEYHLKNYLYDNSREDQENWRNQVRSQLDPSLSPEEKNIEFYLKYTQMMDREGMKHMNPNQKAAAIINASINELGRKKATGDWTLEDEKEYLDLLEERSEFTDESILYDAETGKILEEGEATQKDIDFNDSVKKKEAFYKNTDLDLLYKRREKLYFQYNWMLNNVVNNHTYTKEDGKGAGGFGSDKWLTIRYKDGKTQKRKLSDDTEFSVDKFKVLEESMPFTYGTLRDVKTELTALNNLILFNQDPADVQRKGFGGAFTKAYDEYWMGDDREHYDTQAKEQIQALENAGFDLTQSQLDRVEDTQWEKLGSTVGGSVPAMAEILFWSMVAKNAGAAASALGNTEKLIATVSGGSKRLESVLTASNNFLKSKGVYKAVTSGAVYEMAGQGFSTGVGESVGQGLAESMFSKTFNKNFWGQFMLRVMGGGTGESIAEYSGEFLQHLEDNGYDFDDAVKKTMGENPTEKLLHTFIVSLMFSAPNSFVKSSQSYALRKYIESNASELGIEEEAVNEILDINNEDGKFEERAKKVIANDTDVSDVSRYKSLKKKKEADLTDEDKLEMQSFEFSVDQAGDLMSPDVQAAIQNVAPELSKEAKKVSPDISKEEGAAFDLTKEEEIKKEEDVKRKGEGAVDTGKKQDITGDEQKESVSGEVRPSADKGDTAKPTPKKILTKDENKQVQSVDSEEKLQVLKSELGIPKSKAKSPKQIQRAYMKKEGSSLEGFMKAVNAATGEVQTQEQIQAFAKAQDSFKQGEVLIKQGKTKEGVAKLTEAKELSPDLTDRADVAISVAQAGKIDVAKEAEKERAVEAKEAAKAVEKSKSKLEGIRSDLIGTTVESGDVLKVDRTATEGEYSVLVKTGDQTADKGSYNPETGEITMLNQNKTEQKNNFNNFEASKERKTGSKAKGIADRKSELSNEITRLATGAKMITTRGKNTGKPKASIQKLLDKIAFAETEKASKEFVDKFNSELNGIIKDDASIEELKLKRKLQNMMSSAMDVTAEAKIETKKKPVKKEKTAKKVKTTTNPDFDAANQTLENAKVNISDITLKQFVSATKVEGKVYAQHLISLEETGKITKQEYLELQDKYKKIWSEKKVQELNQISKAEEAIDAGSLTDEFSGLDESMQSAPKPIGGNSPENTGGRVQPRTITKKKKKSFISKLLDYGKREKNVVTPDVIMSNIADEVSVKVFKKSMDASKKPRWVGKFNSSTNAITLRSRRDIDVFIHEIGHKISYKHGINEDVSDGSFDDELSKLWIYGSNPPKSIRSKSKQLSYRREEGVAEFIRAYSINPEVASQIYPKLNSLIESKLDQNTKTALDDYGDGYSSLANMAKGEWDKVRLFSQAFKTQTQVRSEGEITNNPNKAFMNQMGGAFQRMFAKKSEGINIGFWTNMNMAVVEKSAALKKTVDFARRKGIDIPNSADPYYLIRLMSNYQRNRLKNLTEMGLVDATGRRVETKSGDLMNYSWLYENLDTSSDHALDKDIELVENYMIAQNIVWRRDENGDVDVTGAGFGLIEERKLAEDVINQIESLDPEKVKVIKEAAKRYREFALQTVRYLRDTGRITPKHFSEIEANQDNYVSLRASLEDIGAGSVDKFRSRTIRSVLDLKKRGKGSDVIRDNPYSNLTAVLMESYYEGDRNHAVRSYVNMLSGKDSEGKSLVDGEGNKVEINEIRNSSNKVDGDVEIKFYEKGELKKVWMAADLAASLESATKSNNPLIGFDILGKLFKDLPQSMITSTLSFANKNFIRDKGHQIFVSRRKFNPIKDFKLDSGVISDIKRDFDIESLKRKRRNETINEAGEARLKELETDKAESILSNLELYGGTMSGWYFRDRSNYYGLLNKVKDELVKEGRTVFWKPQRFLNPSKAWKKWKSGVAKTEEIHRMHEFKAVYKEEYNKWYNKFIQDGVPVDEAKIKANHEANIKAAFEAKDLMDFTVSGYMMSNVNRLFMFLNPAIQGWNRTIKTFNPNNPKSWGSIGLRLAFYTAIPTIMERMWAAYNDDEEELQEMPSYQKDMFWNIKIGPDTWFRIPKPFEMGMPSSGFSRLYDYQVNDDENAFDGYWHGMKEMFVPVDGSSLLDNPFVQLYTGRDEFLGKDIVPYYEKDLDLTLRDPKYSSELGKSVHDIGVMDARKFDHFIKKTFSNWGNLMLNVGDKVFEGENADPLFSQRDVGVLSESPFYQSRSYSAVRDMQSEWGVSHKHEDLDKLYTLQDRYRGAETSKEKDDISEDFRNEARRVRDRWDDIIERDGNLHSIGGKGTPEEEKKEDRIESSTKRSSKRRKFKRKTFKR